MKVFCHHVYEYRKGLRNLILHTMDRSLEAEVRRRLDRKGISYVIYPLGSKRMNVFFGSDSCVSVVRKLDPVNLTHMSPEQDFILGAMLGYDLSLQCERYLDKKEGEENARRQQVA